MVRWEFRNTSYPLLQAWRERDPLGVILDQRYWLSDLQKLLNCAEIESLSVLKMDLDNFKSINDQLGHAQGDEAIRIYCRIVEDESRGIGFAYRRGGDEVVVIALETGEVAAIDLCERIRVRIEKDFKIWCEQRNLQSAVTASIGALSVICPSSSEDVIERCDALQKRAKEEGKNRVVSEVMELREAQPGAKKVSAD
jgi:diguanylate cyclase (GGDEF)-like protein